MSIIRPIFCLLLLGLAAFPLYAQPEDPLGGNDTITLENERIDEVITSEKPFLKPPYQDIKQGSNEEIRFQSKDFYVKTAFEPIEPDVRSLDKEKLPPLTNNFLRLGIGRYVTPWAQLYLNNGRDRNVDYGLQFEHKSAHSDEIPLRNFRTDQGRISVSSIDKDYTGKAFFDLSSQSYWYYAGDDTTFIPGDAETRKDSLRMGQTRLELGGQLLSNYDPDASYFYDAGVNLHFYRDRNKNQEVHIQLKPTGGILLRDEVSIQLLSEITYVRGKIDTFGQNRFFTQLTPTLEFDNESIKVQAGINFAYFRNSQDSTGVSNLGPVIRAEFVVDPQILTIVAGYTSGMEHNHYSGMMSNNPYLNPLVDIRPTVEKMNIYAGVEGNLGQNIDYAAKAFYKRRANQLMFINPDSVRFLAVYDSLMTVTGLHAELNYNLDNGLQVGAALNLNTYATSNQDSLTERYFHAAPIRLDAYGSYVWEEKLTAKAELFVFGPTPMSIDPEGEIIRRSPFLDLNLSADYRITENLSVFLTVNNLLNSNYQRWFNYPERRIDVMGGLTLAF